MIQIERFSDVHGHSLAEMVDTLRKSMALEMQVRWYYDEADALRIRVWFNAVDTEPMECLLSAYLSANGFLYVRQSGGVMGPVKPGTRSLRHYAFVPEDDGSEPAMFTDASLNVLLTELLRCHGQLLIRVVADSTFVRMAVSIDAQEVPLAANFAFGSCFKLAAIRGEFPFEPKEWLYPLLQLPFVGEGGNPLVNGYGGDDQARVNPAQHEILLGSIAGDVMGRQLMLSAENMKSATLITGISGYGKTTLVKNILTQAYHEQRVSFLAIEPAKQEYQDLKTQVPELQVVSDMSVFNFLLPPQGVSPFVWSDVIAEMITSALTIPAESPLPGYIRSAYEQCAHHSDYSAKALIGYFLALTKPLSERSGDFRTAGKFLLENYFRYINGPQFVEKKLETFDVERFLARPTVINLGSIPSPALKTTLIFFVIKQLQAYLMRKPSVGHIQQLLVLEEAHHVLGAELPQRLLSEVTAVLRESRAKGLQTIIAEQSPSALSQAAVNQVGNIISLRLPFRQDQEIVVPALICEPEELNSIPKYTAIIRTNQMYQPAVVRLKK